MQEFGGELSPFTDVPAGTRAWCMVNEILDKPRSTRALFLAKLDTNRTRGRLFKIVLSLSPCSAAEQVFQNRKTPKIDLINLNKNVLNIRREGSKYRTSCFCCIASLQMYRMRLEGPRRG